MAEGGVPKDEVPSETEGKVFPVECDPLKHVDIEELSSLELVFARDLITYVMRRRIPIWDFGDRYGGPSPVTPFSYRVRNAVEHYLIKEDINIYFLFARGFTGLPLNYHAFIVASSYIVDTVYPNVRSPNDLLRLMALLAQYTVLAYKRGIYMAPYYALIKIQDLLYSYIKQKGIRQNVFYANLGIHAEALIRETPLVPHELLL
ncbi:hypothetical protein AVEN_185596-1 [Araneus ventricosus]|uniref:Uncharacterized protein n=1 Tax=Araneus ventricosus TaxID=182803 RepID=A0A4Y2SB07_ARAVE|nr:hypothetical protein AVEN_185596-1 [Araneus ventricosus]